MGFLILLRWPLNQNVTRGAWCIGVFLFVLFGVTPTQAHAKRLALVIGNASYLDSPLKNPVNDARAVGQKLQKLGFEVTKVEDLKIKAIGRTIAGFTQKIEAGDEVIFFYAGHGLQVGGVNYLPAVDAQILSEDDVPLNSLNLNIFLERLDDSKAGVKILILDACRNNPFQSGFRSINRGLARVSSAASGTLMHFATRPGSVAADGDGSNGLYTTELLKYMGEPDLPVELMLKKVSAAVEKQSKGQQTPWMEGSIKGDFYFDANKGPSLTPSRPGPLDVEQKAWELAERIDSKVGYENYLKEYPGGNYSSLARISLGKFESKSLVVVPAEKPEPAPKPPSVANSEMVAGKQFTDCEGCPEMVVIPSSFFRMGDLSGKGNSFERPVRRVRINTFAMGKYEVTFAQWDACVADGGCSHRPSDSGWGRGNRPVVDVSWTHVTTQYIPWLNRKTGKTYRLPSEAEWEYAARAGSETEFWWGNSINTSQANYDGGSTFNGSPEGEYRTKTVPVDSFDANPFGMYNVHGNVSEWVQDCWNENYNEAPSHGRALGTGDCSRRLYRGGAWRFGPVSARSAARHWYFEYFRYDWLGFRLARTL